MLGWRSALALAGLARAPGSSSTNELVGKGDGRYARFTAVAGVGAAVRLVDGDGVNLRI